MNYPIYLAAYQSGDLNKISEKALRMLEACSICPRKCGVNRLKDELGFCKTSSRAKVCSFMPHYGEEPPISGVRGSGTIFFTYCNMSCVYCQNYQFSQLGEGREVEEEELANFMIQLQNMGCHNINLVTPTHVMPQILKALMVAIPLGLKIPLCYNTGGYELPEIIELLDGIVDIYLPDMRYGNNESGIKYSNAPDYPKYNQLAVRLMHKQVGIPEFDERGVIKRGLIIRHLVLPNNLSGTEKIMEFLAKEVSKDCYISLMSQYYPCYKAQQYPEIARRVTAEEYEFAKDIMQKYGLDNGWIQESFGMERFKGTHIKRSI